MLQLLLGSRTIIFSGQDSRNQQDEEDIWVSALFGVANKKTTCIRGNIVLKLNMHIHSVSRGVKLIGVATCWSKTHSPTPVSSYTNIFYPCSTKKGLSCKGSDRPHGVREIHFTNIVLFAAKVSLQQFVSGLTNGHSHPLAGYNNVLNICIQLNLSVLISSISPAYSTETALFSSGDEKEL